MEKIKSPLPKAINELEMVKESDRLLAIVTQSYLELLTSSLLPLKMKNTTEKPRYYQRLLILNEIGVINDKQYYLYKRFSVIRNSATHEPFFILNENHKNDLEKFGWRPTQDFFYFCKMMILDFWHIHGDDLRSEYAI